MDWYPFDYQTCTQEFQINNILKDFVKVTADQFNYNGSKKLKQYDVIWWRINKESNTENVVLKFKLSRGLISTVLTIFLPTVILMMISFTTTFFKEDYFDSIIGVNLTVMLVLVTMFTSVNRVLFRN
jgi:hypothetical protein